ncbi:hypothetical protein F5Y13DRAFT_197689 [Hypoxylon sp. FL1857]|nr:hypothetical protein F5Y13DRAFT_197689 [Hypoxylon sp. FL1857]
MSKILDNDNDFLLSEKLRHNDAVVKASMTRPEGRRPHRERAVSPRPAKNALAKDRKAEISRATPDDTKPQPLFSDDVYDISDMNGKVTVKPGESVLQEKQARRQILENLLDYEVPRNGSRGTSLLEDVQGHSSSCGLDQVRKGATTDGLDSRHLRGLSGFSFLPGDDVSPVLTGTRTDNDTMVSAIDRKYDDDGIETRRHRRRNAVGNSRGQADNEPVLDLATPLKSWENRWWLTSEKALPQDPSTSSVDTVIRAVKDTTAVAAYESLQNTTHIAPRMPPNGDGNQTLESMPERTTKCVTISPGQHTGKGASTGPASAR